MAHKTATFKDKRCGVHRNLDLCSTGENRTDVSFQLDFSETTPVVECCQFMPAGIQGTWLKGAAGHILALKIKEVDLRRGSEENFWKKKSDLEEEHQTVEFRTQVVFEE